MAHFISGCQGNTKGKRIMIGQQCLLMVAMGILFFTLLAVPVQGIFKSRSCCRLDKMKMLGATSVIYEETYTACLQKHHRSVTSYCATIELSQHSKHICHGMTQQPWLCAGRKYNQWTVYENAKYDVIIESNRTDFYLAVQDGQFIIQHMRKSLSFSHKDQRVFQIIYSSHHGYNILKHKATGRYLGVDHRNNIILVDKRASEMVDIQNIK